MAHSLETQPTKIAKLDDDVIRKELLSVKEQLVTSGVSDIIESMVPFHSLELDWTESESSTHYGHIFLCLFAATLF